MSYDVIVAIAIIHLIVDSINPCKLSGTLVGTALWEPWLMKTFRKKGFPPLFFCMGWIEKSVIVLWLHSFLFLFLDLSRSYAAVWWPLQWTGESCGKKQQKTLGCGAVCHFRNILHSDCHLSVPFLSELGAIKHLEGWGDDLVGEVLPAKVQCLEHT